MRPIKTAIIHCSATKPSMGWTINEIRDLHVNKNKWSDIGYHFVIERNGDVMTGRPINKAGAHAKGFNSDSVGICLVGGLNENGQPEANFTDIQWKMLRLCVTSLVQKYKIKDVIGHNQVSNKACPCFDVPEWWNEQS